MTEQSLIVITIAYLLLLFGFAFLFRKYSSFSNSKYAYALSICVYCTAWTFYGSIGRSAETGFGYLGVYLGPTIIAPLMLVFLAKTIKISKYLRISSLADFISARYGKDTVLGTMVTILCVLIAIPYISIQLKALNLSMNLLAVDHVSQDSLFKDPVLYFGLFCAFLSAFFGTVKAAPTERHTGLISIVAIESVIKLIAFLIGAAVIIYSINDGIGSIFVKYESLQLEKEIFDLRELGQNGNQWFWVSLISAFAFLLLPRQFHMSVIENKDVSQIKFASWFVPFYFFAISIFVLPIALAGISNFGSEGTTDNYFSLLLISEELNNIALIVFIGGIAASTGMIISSLISLSIMMSNHILLPLLVKFKTLRIIELEGQIVQFRRLLIFVILMLSYLFYKYYGVNYSLVSIGLISFVGICQLVPSYLLGLFWRFGNAKGIKAGLIAGVLIWVYTLPVVNLCEMGLLSESLLSEGPFGIEFLKPQAIFGLDNMDPISMSSFISLTTNVLVTIFVSLISEKNALEISQSDIYLYPDKYLNEKTKSVISSEANFSELKEVLTAIIGKEKVKVLLDNYSKDRNISEFSEYADTELIVYLENYLGGSLGSAGTKLILENIVKSQPVLPEQLYRVLDQTNQLFEYSQELEQKTNELKETSKELFEANNKLLEFDQLKNEFISNITHELRTPLTSIHSLADSLENYDLTEEEQEKVISIMKKESNRISGLVNQVLDLRKLESVEQIDTEKFDLIELINEVAESLKDRQEGRQVLIENKEISIYSDPNKIKQIILNILSNAIKFTDSRTGKIDISVKKSNSIIEVSIKDNGIGIPKKDLAYIFDRFFQASNVSKGKNVGSGLGLSISKHLAELLDGQLKLKSKENSGTEFIIELKDLNNSNRKIYKDEEENSSG